MGAKGSENFVEVGEIIKSENLPEDNSHPLNLCKYSEELLAYRLSRVLQEVEFKFRSFVGGGIKIRSFVGSGIKIRSFVRNLVKIKEFKGLSK